MAYNTKQQQNKRQEYQPPHNLDAEKAVLGSILKDDQAIHTVIEVYDTEVVFYAPKHRMIFRGMLDLYERHEPCDITTLSNLLSGIGSLEEIGGRVYLVDLAEYVVSTANVKHHAARLVLKAENRLLQGFLIL